MTLEEMYKQIVEALHNLEAKLTKNHKASEDRLEMRLIAQDHRIEALEGRAGQEPTTFGDLNVGEEVGYTGSGGISREVVVYRNTKSVVLSDQDDDLSYFRNNETLNEAGRIFLRRGEE